LCRRLQEAERVVQTAESETPRPHQTSSDHICLDPGVLSPEASPCAVLWLCVSGEQGKSTRAEGKSAALSGWNPSTCQEKLLFLL
ncbi:hypothetical protein JOQ06_015850, partial [Pogonophryne albipinna]